jgi:hypothetical protein
MCCSFVSLGRVFFIRVIGDGDSILYGKGFPRIVGGGAKYYLIIVRNTSNDCAMIH